MNKHLPVWVFGGCASLLGLAILSKMNGWIVLQYLFATACVVLAVNFRVWHWIKFKK